MKRMKSIAIFSVVLAITLPALAQTKLPIPDTAARKTAAAEIKEIYGEEFSKAKTPSKKIELAKKLLQEGIATKSNPTSRYVLFRIAKDIVAGAGDSDTAFQAIDQMDKYYKIDSFTLKYDTLIKAAKNARTKEATKIIVEKASLLIEESVQKDKYDLAKELGKIALAAARKVRDLDSAKKIVKRNKEIKAIAQEYEEVKTAFVTLETKPADPEANSSAGMFYCLSKGNWEKGLHMLALGNDAAIKDLAMKELKGAKGTDFLVLGNGWWKQAEKAEGLAKKQLQAHAAIWFRKALPGLTGIDKTKVVKRLAQVPVTTTQKKLTGKQVKQKEQWISKKATYRVSSIADQYNPLPSFLNENQRFHKGGFAFHTNGAQGEWVTIDLGKKKTITRVVILNRNDKGDSRQEILNWSIGMSLYISSDGKKQQKAWTARQGLPGWNVRLPKPIEGRFVTLQLPTRAAKPVPLTLKKVMVFGFESTQRDK